MADPDVVSNGFEASELSATFREVLDSSSRLKGAVKHAATVNLKVKNASMAYSTETPAAKSDSINSYLTEISLHIACI